MSTLGDRMADAEFERVEEGVPADGFYTIPPDDEPLVEDYDLEP